MKQPPCDHESERISERLFDLIEEVLEDEGFDSPDPDDVEAAVAALVSELTFGPPCEECKAEAEALTEERDDD